VDPKVFISYRRRDSAGHAGRLYDALTTALGEGRVFMDVDMPPGVDFVQRITQAVGACDVLIVVMGPHWATLADEEGNLRIADREDFVRLEVEIALRRPDVTVIPVLVAGGQMPDPAALPEGLRALARRNAIELSDMRWRYDVERLLGTLRALLPQATGELGRAPDAAPREAERPAAQGVTVPARPWFQLLLEGVAVALVAGLVGRSFDLLLRGDPADDKLSRIVDSVVWRAETWMFVGAALAIWLTLVSGERRSVTARAFAGLLVGALAGALAGAAYGLPRFLIEDLQPEEIHLISDSSYAVLGGVLGAMIGALWIQPRPRLGLSAGAVAGFLQHALWLNQGWSGKYASVTLQCLVVVGAVLSCLLALDTLSGRPSRSRTALG
jgi:hypothetical protein